jgi:hypothetical protein
VRARGRGDRRRSRGEVARRRRKGKGKELTGVGRWGRRVRGREGEKARSSWGTGRAGPGVAHAEERREGVGDGPWARAGPCGEEKREGKRRVGCWAGLLLSFLSFSSLLFPFYTQTIETNLFEFK